MKKTATVQGTHRPCLRRRVCHCSKYELCTFCVDETICRISCYNLTKPLSF